MKHLTDANKNKLLGFLRSRAAAGEASLKSWGRTQRPQIPGILAEEIADALVAEGKATRETKVHGGRVWRAAVEPIEKKHLDLSLEEPTPEPDVEGAAEEEPVAVAGAAEPCQRCAGLNATVATWERNWGSHGIERMVLQSEIASLRQERDLAKGEAFGLRQERDRLADQLAIRTTERDDLAVRLDRTEDHRCHLAQMVGLDGGAEWSAVRPAIARALQETSTPRPAVDGGTMATYLTRLTDEQWLTVQRGRAQLAEARDLRAKAAALEADGTRILEGLLDTPAGAQAPAPVAPEPRVELVPPPPPPSGEQEQPPRRRRGTRGQPAPLTVRARILDLVEDRGQVGTADLVDAIGGSRASVEATANKLVREGALERCAPATYRLARKARRAA